MQPQVRDQPAILIFACGVTAALPCIQFIKTTGLSPVTTVAALLIVLTAGSGLILGWLAWLLKPLRNTVLIFLIAYALWFIGFIEFDYEKLKKIGDERLYSVLLFSAIGIFTILFSYVLVRFLKRNTEPVISVVGTVVILSSLLVPSHNSAALQRHGALDEGLDQSLPPFIYIILDGHMGVAGLPPEFVESERLASEIRRVYRDFAQYETAYSQYAETYFALGSFMNGTAPDEDPPVVAHEDDTWTFQRNALYDLLAERGYQLSVYDTKYVDLCRPPVSVCNRYSIWSPRWLTHVPISLHEHFEIVVRAFARPLGVKRASHLAPLAAETVLTRALEDLRENPRGVAYIVHLFLPHAPYMFEDDCAARSQAFLDHEDERAHMTARLDPNQRARAYPKYLRQALCTTKRIDQFLDQLRRSDIYRDATILVSGDHGSRLSLESSVRPDPEMTSARDAIDLFSTFLAIKRPGISPGPITETVSVAEIFGAEFFGRRLPHAEDHFGKVRMTLDQRKSPIFHRIEIPDAMAAPDR